jgi:hypothetical protein
VYVVCCVSLQQCFFGSVRFACNVASLLAVFDQVVQSPTNDSGAGGDGDIEARRAITCFRIANVSITCSDEWK